MLLIHIPERESKEVWDDKQEEFRIIPYEKGETLKLEHSLLSISKWEAKYHKAFLPSRANNKPKTNDEMLYYIKCMTINEVRDEVYLRLTVPDIKKISDYISDPMTATTFSKNQSRGGNAEIITSEIIYYWMVEHGIPFECQKWHINRLLTLIQVCNLKRSPQKMMNKHDILKQNQSLNALRRAKYHSRG
jgi:hypothetical protein